MNSERAETVYKDSGERVPMGTCERHAGIHVQSENCENFKQATSREIAEDTFARF